MGLWSTPNVFALGFTRRHSGRQVRHLAWYVDQKIGLCVVKRAAANNGVVALVNLTSE